MIAGVLAFWLHRGLIEVVAVMAALGIVATGDQQCRSAQS